MSALADLAGLPDEVLRWCALAYSAGIEDGDAVGFRRAEDEMAMRWAAAADQIRRVLDMPTQDELRERRTPRAAA